MAILIGLLILSLFLNTDVATGLLIILFVVSVIYISISPEKSQKLMTYEYFLVLSFFMFSLISVVWLFIFDVTRDALVKNEAYSAFALSIPILVFLRKMNFNFIHYMPKMFLFIGSFVFIVAVYQVISWEYFNAAPYTFGNHFVEHTFYGRAVGGLQPIRFGALSLALSGISLIGAIHLVNKKDRSFLAIVFMLFFIASLLSGSRGPMLSIPFIFMFLLFGSKSFSLKSAFIGVALASVFLSLVVYNTPVLKNRITAMVIEVDLMLSGNLHTSIGARIDMGIAAGLLIKERPVLGSGLSSYKEGVNELRKNGYKFGGEVGKWKNPHNEWLNVAVEKGIFGVFSLFLLFGSLIYFYLYTRRHPSNQAQFLGEAAIVLLIVYFASGLSIALFEHKPFTYFYIIISVLLYSAMHSIDSNDAEKFKARIA